MILLMDSNGMEKQGKDFIKFLGTAGARFVVSEQLRASAASGSLGEEKILVDPARVPWCGVYHHGPSWIFCFKRVILTHRH